ncbi:hypothetical protein [Paenibacillus dendritiformis]|uniref:hypothetical protein n=1 Tax=Paenibacillus dendritiformis TaxID=130049 RepID=UPI000DA976AF|nr:hypothetical protein [Paenibacillus dendritiformis]NKI22888.1 hypothetical protein [Paenibacillus dendritiformis]NRG00451.1 hypothetical protein [Paenibacillus dendritiformis]PZM62178.1 hypothetical protein DOE73_28680 [Paenibacillus dendritiformis]
MPEWVKEALCQRLELLTGNAEMLHDVLLLKNKLHQLENLFIDQLNNAGEKKLHREWLALHEQIATLQKGWLYAKGVQDGVKMMIFHQRSEQDLNADE